MPEPSPFTFISRAPAPPLDAAVKSIWYARGTVPYRREKIGPTGSTVAVIVLGPPMIETANNGEAAAFVSERGFLLGPHDRPVLNEPTGETYAVGIVTMPIGCERIFGVRPGRIRGKVVDLATNWARAAALRNELRELGQPKEMLDAVETTLGETVNLSIPGFDRCQQVVRMLESEPTRPISEIAADVGLSHEHLDREFTRVVGLSPRVLARLLRVRRLLDELDIDVNTDWASRARELGWYDQAHLIRDFKRHTGVTPRRYIAAQRTQTTSQQQFAPGFVPEY